MNERLANIRGKMHTINNKLDEIHLLLCEMTDISKGVLDLLDERNALQDWETKLREHYNEYATMNN